MTEKSDESRKKSSDEPIKIGVYVCHCGGNISDVVDVHKVKEALSDYPNVSVSTTNMFMCSNAGQALIEEDIKSGKINRVVVASCTPSLHRETFRGAIRRGGMNQYLYEHANIREQDSWVHSDDHEGATKKAIALVKAAVNRTMTKSFTPMESLKVPVKKHALIIGGGVAGLRAAKDLSSQGIPVDLVEKTPYLGGRVALLDKLYPTKENAQEILATLITDVLNDPYITIHLSSSIESVTGYIGNYEVTIKEHKSNYMKNIESKYLNIAINSCPVEIEGEYDLNGLSSRKAIYKPYPGNYPQSPVISWEHCTKCGKCKEALGPMAHLINLEVEEKTLTMKTGVIIVASGFKHYRPHDGEYGFNKLVVKERNFPLIVTLPQLTRMLSPEGIFSKELSWQNLNFKNIVFIHCVGSRQVEGINEPQKDGLVNDYCSRVCCTATLQAANELKEKFTDDVNVFELYQDIRAYGRFHETRYYEQACKNGVKFLKYLAEEPPEVVPSEDGTEILVKVKDQLTYGEEIEIKADLIVLSVGMMPGNDTKKIAEMLNIPIGSDRFLLEGHPKLKPVETSTTGILLAGSVQAPMDVTETVAAAAAAASKASILLSSKEYELEPFVAKVDPLLCLGEECSKCISQCGYEGVLQMVDTTVNGKQVKRAHVNEALCKGCGACVAVCPVRGAIEVAGYHIEQFEVMVDAFAKEALD